MPNRGKVIKGLEHCNKDGYARNICADCPYVDKNPSECIGQLMSDALAMLKEQETSHDFLDWLACSVVLADDFETNPGFYREVICRKLVRLGMLELEGDRYVLPDPTQWRGEVTEDAD